MIDENKPKRKRNTREEQLAKVLLQAEILKAKIAGTFTDEGNGDVLKGLKARLRKTQKVLASSDLLRHGSDGKDCIETKIVKARARLASLIESHDRADVFLAKLPFDIERMEALIKAGEAGDEIDFPTDLVRLPDEQKKTKEQHEATALEEQLNPE